MKRRGIGGQVAMEFVIMLVLAVVLALALVALFNAIGASGDRAVSLASYEVP